MLRIGVACLLIGGSNLAASPLLAIDCSLPQPYSNRNTGLSADYYLSGMKEAKSDLDFWLPLPLEMTANKPLT